MSLLVERDRQTADRMISERILALARIRADYSIPTMGEIANLPFNGFNVVSTFSGCGGSCLGFEMAGFRILWANEFVEEAARTYAENHPKTILDRRDIRAVTGDSILEAIARRFPDAAGREIDVLEGSPPCASFSSSGSRSEGWGKVKKYSDVKQRVDDLFFEFIRILGELKPRTFIAENVSGLVRGTAKGYFIDILRKLRAAGYIVESKLLDAQWLGVPQVRKRIIFAGVREDLATRFVVRPEFPIPFRYRYSLRDALVSDKPYEVESETDISRFAIGREWDRLRLGEKGRYLNFIKPVPTEPCPTITQEGGKSSAASVVHPYEKRKFSIAETKRISSFPEDFILTGTFQQKYERLGRSVPPLMMRAIAETVRDYILMPIESRAPL